MISGKQVLSSVRRKILLVFVLGLVLPVLVAAWISYRAARNVIYSHSLEQQERALSQISRDVWTLEDQSRRQIRMLGTSHDLSAALKNGTSIPEDLIRIFLRVNPHWKDVALYNTVGSQVWKSESQIQHDSFDPFFLETYNLGENQTPVFSLGNEYRTRFGLSVSDQGQFAGIITASLDLSVVERSLRQLRELNALRAILWDDRGTIFASNLNPAEQQEVGRQIVLSQAGQEILNLSGKALHREIEIAQEPILFSATVVPEFISPRDPIPGENWFVATLSPSTRAFGELWAFQSRILIFLIFLFAAATLFLFWITRRISSPLEEMASFSEQVSKGKRNIRLEIPGNDEVARLSGALNSMAVALRHYENELVRNEVLASLGKMSSLVAHEIRNPLNAIKGSVQYLQLKFPSDAVISEYSRIILEKADRLSNFVNSLLKFARLPAAEIREIEIRNLYDRAVQSFRAQAESAGVTLDLVLDGAQRMRCDRDQIIELMENVIQNSLAVLPPGGKLEVIARKAQDFVEIEFRDNGPGISPEVSNRLFVPFSSGRREGTGLGLVLCKMIAENHGGSFQYLDAGKGACFVLRIPQPPA